jgi:FlaG/FlaF family flagellin (archaellin)
MKKNKASLLSVSAVAALLGVGYSISSAQEAPTEMEQRTTTVERSQSGSSAENVRMVTLTVKEVDEDEHKVTFEAKVRPEANLEKNGRAIKIDELSEGYQLKVSIDTKSGEVVRAQVVQKR